MQIAYISGWQALNIPNENGITADWHWQNYFTNDRKPLEIFYLDSHNPLKREGIKKHYVPFLNDTHYIASFARAIADLVYNDRFTQLQYCANDFLNEKEQKELYKYLKIINKSKNVEHFMKYELTKMYFKDKNYV